MTKIIFQLSSNTHLISSSAHEASICVIHTKVLKLKQSASHNKLVSEHQTSVGMTMSTKLTNEPHHEKTGFLHMRENRRRSASR